MKYISSAIFIVALVWTWNVIHSFENVSFETHANLQVKLAEVIKETVKLKKPAAEDLQIIRLWTEQLSENKVRAAFAYKFNELSETGEAVESIIEGEALLTRESDVRDEVDAWRLDEVKTTNDAVTFSQGVIIGPNTETTTPEVAPATTPETAPQAPTEPVKNEQ